MLSSLLLRSSWRSLALPAGSLLFMLALLASGCDTAGPADTGAASPSARPATFAFDPDTGSGTLADTSALAAADGSFTGTAITTQATDCPGEDDPGGGGGGSGSGGSGGSGGGGTGGGPGDGSGGGGIIGGGGGFGSGGGTGGGSGDGSGGGTGGSGQDTTDDDDSEENPVVASLSLSASGGCEEGETNFRNVSSHSDEVNNASSAEDIFDLLRDAGFPINSAEEQRCRNNLGQCRSWAIASLDAQLAAKTTVNYVGGPKDSSPLNAFKHAFWNARMTHLMGPSKAKQWADIHEPTERGASDMTDASAMDFYNNEEGRSIALERSYEGQITESYMTHLKGQVWEAVENGRLRKWACGSHPGSWHPGNDRECHTDDDIENP